jgi:hypothetical protein
VSFGVPAVCGGGQDGGGGVHVRSRCFVLCMH